MAEYKQPQVVATPKITHDVDPNTLKAQEIGKKVGTPRVSLGDPGRENINMNGETKIRGTGAATKGTKARGPMA